MVIWQSSCIKALDLTQWHGALLQYRGHLKFIARGWLGGTNSSFSSLFSIISFVFILSFFSKNNYYFHYSALVKQYVHLERRKLSRPEARMLRKSDRGQIALQRLQQRYSSCCWIAGQVAMAKHELNMAVMYT